MLFENSIITLGADMKLNKYIGKNNSPKRNNLHPWQHSKICLLGVEADSDS